MAATSTLPRMPSELLEEIFAYSLTTRPFRSPQRAMFRSLTAVCRMWKETAKGTPRLCRGLVLQIDKIHLRRHLATSKDSGCGSTY
jgi:F-box-like